MLSGGRDLHALELAVGPDIDIKVTGILVEVQERPRSPREITALALMQLGELTQSRQQRLDVIKVVRCRMPHPSSMTLDITPVQAPTRRGPGAASRNVKAADQPRLTPTLRCWCSVN